MKDIKAIVSEYKKLQGVLYAESGIDNVLSGNAPKRKPPKIGDKLLSAEHILSHSLSSSEITNLEVDDLVVSVSLHLYYLSYESGAVHYMYHLKGGKFGSHQEDMEIYDFTEYRFDFFDQKKDDLEYALQNYLLIANIVAALPLEDESLRDYIEDLFISELDSFNFTGSYHLKKYMPLFFAIDNKLTGRDHSSALSLLADGEYKKLAETVITTILKPKFHSGYLFMQNIEEYTRRKENEKSTQKAGELLNRLHFAESNILDKWSARDYKSILPALNAAKKQIDNLNLESPAIKSFFDTFEKMKK